MSLSCMSCTLVQISRSWTDTLNGTVCKNIGDVALFLILQWCMVVG